MPNIEGDPAVGRAFYADVLGLAPMMDQGWIVTCGTDAAAPAQVSVMTTGGSGTPVPALSVEVDDLDATLARVKAAGMVPEYGPVSEPWGVRRFYVRDPFGTLINVLCHE